MEAAYQAALAFRLTEMAAGGSRWPDRPPQVLLGVFTAAAPGLLVAAVGPYRKHAPLFIKDGTFGQRGQEFARREPASGPLLEDVGWQGPDKLVNSAAFLVVGHGHHDDDSAWITAARLPVSCATAAAPRVRVIARTATEVPVQ